MLRLLLQEVDEKFQGVLDKRGKDLNGPPLGKRLLLWLDDMNLPQRDSYGTQQPLALLRQLFDRKAQSCPPSTGTDSTLLESLTPDVFLGAARQSSSLCNTSMFLARHCHGSFTS